MTEKYYKNNLAAFSKRYPEVAAFVDQLDVKHYELQSSKSGEAALRVNRNGDLIWIDDPDDPRAEAKKNVPLTAHKKSLIVVIGMGLGYLLFEAVKKYPESLFIVIEHDPRIFKMALKSHDFGSCFANPNIEFVVARKPERLTGAFSDIITKPRVSNYMPNLLLVANNRIVQFSQNYYQKVGEVLKTTLNFYWEGIVGNDYKDTLIGLKHVLANLKSLPKMMCLEPYRDYFKGKPGIVVSSGPSLSRRLDDLRAIQNKAVIICADSALKLLVNNGIRPFGVSSFERVEHAPQLFQGFEIPDDTILFQTLQPKSEISMNYPGPQCMVFRNVFPFGFFPNLMPLRNIGISCAHMSMVMLMILGCNPIALVGQDLAYDRNSGETHFAGAADYARQAEAKRKRIKLPDNQGGTIESTESWELFRDFFAVLINYNPDYKIYDVIERDAGVKIEGTELIEPANFFSKLTSQEEFLPRISCEEGFKYIQSRATPFYNDLKMKLSGLEAGLSSLSQGWLTLKQAADFVSYQNSKEELLTRSDAGAVHFFDSVFQSQLRRFDASAQSLWSDAEFIQFRDRHIDEARVVTQKIIEIIHSCTFV